MPITFPAGPAEIIRSELPPTLLRRWTLSSEMVDASTLLDSEVVDAQCPAAELVVTALERSAALAAQPAFATVKRQVRGPLADRVAGLAAQDDDPFMESFL